MIKFTHLEEYPSGEHRYHSQPYIYHDCGCESCFDNNHPCLKQNCSPIGQRCFMSQM